MVVVEVDPKVSVTVTVVVDGDTFVTVFVTVSVTVDVLIVVEVKVIVEVSVVVTVAVTVDAGQVTTSKLIIYSVLRQLPLWKLIAPIPDEGLYMNNNGYTS